MSSTSKDVTSDMLKAITIRNQKTSPFLRLPAEIRNQIYASIFNNACIELCWKDICGPFGPRSDPFGVPIAHPHYPADLLHLPEVCQQIYAETKFLNFSEGGLSGHHIHVGMFLACGSFTTDQKCAIRKINYKMPQVCLPHEIGLAYVNQEPRPEFTQCLTRLRELKGLQKIVITTFFPEEKPRVYDQAEVREKARRVIKDEGLTVEVDFPLGRPEQWDD